MTEREAIQRMRRGQAAAAARQRELEAAEGPRPAQAVAEALSAIDALAHLGPWRSPDDRGRRRLRTTRSPPRA